MTRSSRRKRTLFAFASTVLCVIAAGREARAGDEASARALFVEGRKLAANGDYPSACEKFEASYRLDPGVGTSFNLADCFEHIGRIASAWTRFLDVATATKAAGQLERERVALSRAAALEPRLPKLILRVTSPVSGLAVRRDGDEVPSPLWGTEVPVDPGDHLVEATAPAKQPWSTKVVIPATPDVVSVEVPRLRDEPAIQIASVKTEPSPAPQPSSMSEKPTSTKLSHSTMWLGGAGLAALAAGAVFGVRFELENGQAKSLCTQPENTCPNPIDNANHQRLYEAAKRDRTIWFVGAGVGTASLAAATYLQWRSTHRASADRGSADIAVVPTGPSGVELAFHASW